MSYSIPPRPTMPPVPRAVLTDAALNEWRSGQASAQLLNRRARFWIAVGYYWDRAKFNLYLAYARTLYRPHMRWLHRRGKHWYTHMKFAEPQQLWCQWCGERYLRVDGPK